MCPPADSEVFGKSSGLQPFDRIAASTSLEYRIVLVARAQDKISSYGTCQNDSVLVAVRMLSVMDEERLSSFV